jgi:pyruvate ferredoxin oxidoreductase alpha subunit
LPSMVGLDGFTLSHVYEPFYIPEQKDIDAFLPDYVPTHAILEPEQPLTLGPIGFPSHYMEMRRAQVEAMEGSLKVIEKIYKEYSEKFPVQIKGTRPEKYSHIEEYKMDDAEIAFVAIGSVCGSIKDVIDDLRSKGEKVGLVKIITYRPFPMEAIKKSLKNVKKVAVLEKAISPGANGPVFEEVCSVLFEAKSGAEVRNYIIGLGGRDVKLDHIQKIFEMTKKGQGKKQEWMF